MPQIGPLEILVVFVVALLVFGPTKLPEIGRQVGRGIAEMRKFQQTLKRDLDDVLADDRSDAAAPAPTLPAKQLDEPELDEPATGADGTETPAAAIPLPPPAPDPEPPGTPPAGPEASIPAVPEPPATPAADDTAPVDRTP